MDASLPPGVPTLTRDTTEGPSKNGSATLDPTSSQLVAQKASRWSSGYSEEQIYTRGSFLSSLSYRDLQRLREIVIRKFYWVVVQRHGWEAVPMTEVDRLIESYGDLTRQKLIKQAVDGGFVK